MIRIILRATSTSWSLRSGDAMMPRMTLSVNSATANARS